jgi:hypothetical protein
MMNDLETVAFIASPSVIILFGLILILVSAITAPDPYEPPQPKHATPEEATTHYEVVEGVIDELETYPQVGRRGLYSAVRAMRVAEDWQPYIGDRLVTILMQSTTEWLFVRKPAQQLTDPWQRAQWATDLATIG